MITTMPNTNEETVKKGTGELASPARPFVSMPLQPLKPIGTRRLIDKIATKIVTLGGIAIIISILAILFVILYEVYPLFVSPKISKMAEVETKIDISKHKVIGIDVDEYQQIATLLTSDGLHFFSIKEGKEIPGPSLKGLEKASITGSSPLGRGALILGLSDGRVIPLHIHYKATYSEKGLSSVEPKITEGEALEADPEGKPISVLAHVHEDKTPITIAKVGAAKLAIITQTIKPNMMGGPDRVETFVNAVSLPIAAGEITCMAMDNRHDNIYVGTSAGDVIRLSLDDPETPVIGKMGRVTSGAKAAVTQMAYVLGDRTVIIGDSEGNVSTWLQAKGAGQLHPLVKVNAFNPHGSAVTAVSISKRNKGFLTAGADGSIQLHYSTTGETLLRVAAGDSEIRSLVYAPKGDGALCATASGQIDQYAIVNSHPEVTTKSLFGKVWYEGYKEPEFSWQSTGGTDDFESKFGLTPLIFGTLKAAFYALLIAIPVALLGALYTSQFMHPSLRAYVKPTVELMAGLPSVVLGFVAGLWLAPAVERVAPCILILPFAIPCSILAALLVWRLLIPSAIRQKIKPGTEVILLVPVVIAGGFLAYWIGNHVEFWFLGGNYREWLVKTMGITYDQRNSLVVGMAMGFAVIPIIFTISEDSLSNVPSHLTAGSLALGANRWQTATRIVLPTASPGIFSAIMIGFGRAVGETMIVLMATGNTPVMDWSIFNGFRALSANVAVELPEAPEGGTLYRVLFLAALLLFFMTFIVNTIAEVVRLRLRRKFQNL